MNKITLVMTLKCSHSLRQHTFTSENNTCKLKWLIFKEFIVNEYMFEVVNYIFFSSLSLFRFLLSRTISYSTQIGIVRKAFFFLSLSLSFSLSIVWLSFSLIGCFIINDLVHCGAYII
jgi:hypothetical protein